MTKFKPNHLLTQSRLIELLSYDPETGIFRWIVSRSSRALAEDVAGSLSKEGYIRITIDSHRFMAHSLAWLYMTGEYIARGIDHQDTIRSNNKWDNLRKATRSQNNMNSNVRSDNITGIKGCRFKASRASPKKYYATITLEGKQKYLGYFLTAQEAADAYRDAAIKHFGEFARFDEK